MNNKLILSALVLAGVASTGNAGNNATTFPYNASTGGLSYTFFNLSPNDWTMTPYGAGANPSAPTGQPALSQGWGNQDGTVGFFNNINISGGSCSKPTSLVYNNIIFYNVADPINTPATIPLSPGTYHSLVEESTAYNGYENVATIADSWVLSSAGGGEIIMANMATAGNAFNIGQELNNTPYPFCAANLNTWYNGFINPPQVAGLVTSGGNAPAIYHSSTNPNGAGFVSQTMNYNGQYGVTPGLVNTGGLWAGMQNITSVATNAPALAVNAVNLSMYPVNLSNYVTSNLIPGYYNYATPIFGGHFTVAVGDPFLVSSYAAKILWYITSGMGYAFNNNSLTALDITNLQNLVAPSGAGGVFNSGSYSADYATWLLGSPGLAQTAMSTMNTAASTPITKESIWGKIFSQAATIAIDAGEAGLAALTDGASEEVKVAVNTTASYGGGFTDAATNAIAVNNTSTLSQPAPISQNAPVVINDTYSAGNLLGMLLTNTFVQAEVNNALPSGNLSSLALYSNDSISTDGLCSNIDITTNLLSGSCGTLSATAQVYNNALSTYENSQSSSQLSLWDSVLTGSDITASNGYMMLQNPSIPTFTPPTQVVYQTGTVPTVNPSITSVNVTFSNPTGMLNVASYTLNNPTSSGSTPAATGVPAFNMVIGTPPMAGQGIVFSPPIYSPGTTSERGYYLYDTTTGIFTVTGYYGVSNSDTYSETESFANSVQTIDMTACAPNSSVTLTLNANPAYANQYGASGELSCFNNEPPVAISSGTYPKPTNTPTIATFNTPMPGGLQAPSFYSPTSNAMSSQLTALVIYNTGTGVLTVKGYGYSNAGNASIATFSNGPQVLDMTTCSTNNVNLTVYPTANTAGGGPVGSGYLTCQSTPSLPYNACVNDPQATGGVIVGITTAPIANGTGAGFELGCACIPSYLEGTAHGTSLGGVFVGATNTNLSGQCN
jgi:hypothetical protein